MSGPNRIVEAEICVAPGHTKHRAKTTRAANITGANLRGFVSRDEEQPKWLICMNSCYGYGVSTKVAFGWA